MPLQQVRHAKLRTDKIADDELDTCCACLVNEVVANIAFPGAESDRIDEAGAIDNLWT